MRWGSDDGAAKSKDPGTSSINPAADVARGGSHSHVAPHGGMLFMAPNGWHHLEGVLVTGSEFRLYLYNNFTKPIRADRFADGSSAEVVQVDQERNEIGQPVKVPLMAAIHGTYLKATIPEEMRLPLDVAVRLKFEAQDRLHLFNFTFDQVSEFVE